MPARTAVAEGSRILMLPISQRVQQLAIPAPATLVPTVLFVGGLGLRLVGLDRQSFWTDELYVLGEARQPLAVLFDPLLHLQHPPGYRLLVHAWAGISLDEGWIRLLPALAGALVIPVIWALARALWPGVPGTAGWAAGLAATAPFLLHYSQDVTSYSWTLLWVSLSIWLLIRASRTDRAGWWAAWTVSAAVALYSHYFSIFPLLGFWLVDSGFWVLSRTSSSSKSTRPNLKRRSLALLGVAALVAPWAAVLLGRRGEVLGSFLYPLTVDHQPVSWLPLVLAGPAHPTFWLSRTAAALAWSALILLVVGAVWSARRAGIAIPRQGVALVLAWWLAAAAGPYIFLRLTTPPDGPTPVRFAAFALPALLLGLGFALAVLPGAARGAVLAIWLLLGAAQWGAELTAPPPQDWRGLLGTVAREARPGDAFLAFPAFHAGAAAATYPVPLAVQGGWFVAEGADPAGAAYWFPPGWTWRGFLNVQATRSTDWVGEVRSRVTGAGRVWYLAGDNADLDGTYRPGPAAERALAATGYRPTQEWHTSPLVLRLYDRVAP